MTLVLIRVQMVQLSMAIKPNYTDEELVQVALNLHEKNGAWPTIEALSNHMKHTKKDRLAKALNKAKSLKLGYMSPRYFEALAYLAGYDSPEDAKQEIEQLDKQVGLTRLNRRQLKALLVLRDPYNKSQLPQNASNSMIIRQIRAFGNPGAREFRRIEAEIKNRPGLNLTPQDIERQIPPDSK